MVRKARKLNDGLQAFHDASEAMRRCVRSVHGAVVAAMQQLVTELEKQQTWAGEVMLQRIREGARRDRPDSPAMWLSEMERYLANHADRERHK
jgi:hypothetical protein